MPHSSAIALSVLSAASRPAPFNSGAPWHRPSVGQHRFRFTENGAWIVAGLSSSHFEPSAGDRVGNGRGDLAVFAPWRLS
jgi:hypothetical protein